MLPVIISPSRCGLSTVSPEDSQTSILMSQGTFSWQGPRGVTEGETETRAGKGSLQLHGLNLHVSKVGLFCPHRYKKSYVIHLLATLYYFCRITSQINISIEAESTTTVTRKTGLADCGLMILNRAH